MVAQAVEPFLGRRPADRAGLVQLGQGVHSRGTLPAGSRSQPRGIPLYHLGHLEGDVTWTEWIGEHSWPGGSGSAPPWR